MSWKDYFLSGSALSLTPEDESQSSTLTDASTNSESPNDHAPRKENPNSLGPSPNSADDESPDDWDLQLSDSSEGSPETAVRDDDRSLDEVSEDQSSFLQSPDPNDSTPETTPDSGSDADTSQEQSSLESRDGEDGVGHGSFDYGREEDVDDEAYNDLRSTDGPRFNKAERFRNGERKRGRNSQSDEVEWESSAARRCESFHGKRNRRSGYSDGSLPKKRRFSHDDFGDWWRSYDPEYSDEGSSEEISPDERSWEKDGPRTIIIPLKPPAESPLISEDLLYSDEELENIYQDGEFVEPEFFRRRRRISDERLREINETWYRMYASDSSTDSDPEGISSPDCAALNVRFALEECFADTEHTITTRIPQVLRTIERKEKLHEFHKNVGEDLTVMYKFVESKAVAQTQQLKESCARLVELDKVPLLTDSMQTHLTELRAAANETVSSMERLRCEKEHFAVEQTLLRSHLEFYRKISEETDAQNKRDEAELAELEQSCIELEDAVAAASKQRDEEEEASELAKHLRTVLENRDALQKELETIQDRIREQREIISFPDRLKIEKLMEGLRAAATDFASSTGAVSDPKALQFAPQLSAEVPDFQDSIKLLENLLKSLSRKSVSTQTVLALRHVNELGSLIEISHESPNLRDSRGTPNGRDSRGTPNGRDSGECKETEGRSQSSVGANSSTALD